MIHPPSALVCPLLALASAVLCLRAAWLVLRRRGSHERLLAFAQLALWILFGVGFTCELVEHLGYRDWQHSFWAAEIPLVCLFLGSGVLLSRAWPDDARRAFRRARRSGAIEFLLMLLVLGCMPLVLPSQHPTGRNLGEPLRRAWELALWGFGGALPECLHPITDAEMQRGVGHLPREVTVAMGTTLIAAWMAITFCALALLARCIRSERWRLCFLLVSPPIVVAVHWSGLLGLRSPVSEPTSDKIWTSDPGLMRSYGPTVLVALLLASALLFAARVRTQRTPPEA